MFHIPGALNNKRLAVGLLLLAMTTSSLSPMPVSATHAISPGASSPPIPHPFTFHKTVCPPVAGPGFARCNSEVVTDGVGGLIVSYSLLTGSYGPAAFRGAYGMSGITATTRTIAIVDAYDDPYVLDDLDTYSNNFSIPHLNRCAVSTGTAASPCIQKVDQNGGTSYPVYNSGWALEIALDVEAVHALCQNCNILLVEATTPSDTNLITAADQRAYLMGANVVSNSWGRLESSGDTSENTYFNHPGVAYVFSTGDSGYGPQYPAASPNVTAVGGTTLLVNSDYSYNSETAWSGAGSGCSAYESKPSFQHDTGCTLRTLADVSADADPNTGAAVILNGTWYQVGGTSLAAPLVAAVFGLAGGVGTTLGNSLPYANLNYGVDLRDVTSGSNGSCSNPYLCTAIAGYDGPTGLGTPLGASAFSAGSPPGAFNKSSPTNGVTGQSTSPTLQWSASSGVSHYEYCYGTSNPCSNWTNNNTGTSISLSNLNSGTTYYWNVKAVNGGGTTYSDGSTTNWSFTTASSTATSTSTPTASLTPSRTPTSTFTPSNTPTSTFTPSKTNTPTFTPSNTSTFTYTPSPTFTFTPASSNTPTLTPSNTPTPTYTPTFTFTFTPTKTNTATLTPSKTPTFTPTFTFTFTPTFTATPTNTPVGSAYWLFLPMLFK